jgi:hypothetical protein
MSLGDLVKKSVTGIDPDQGRNVVDIITFTESSWGLNFKLFPAQRVILKVHYGVPLDTKDKNVAVPEDWRLEKINMMTEAEYLRHLYDEGRSNIRTIVPGDERREMVLAIGRRSGKTTLSACIAAYETYKLLSKGDPQAYYGLPGSDMIRITSVATGRDQAGILYQGVSNHFRKCGIFKQYTANNTMSYAKFQTPKDIERFGLYEEDQKAKASIDVRFESCVAKSLRGAGNLVVILDEVAHFVDSGQSSADSVYSAIKPSLSAFSPKDPNDSRVPIGDVEGRMILISSPLGRQGLFYKLFQMGMRGGEVSADMLCIQAPTWEINPTVPKSEYMKQYLKDPNDFFTEYGAEFSDRTKGWIEEARDLEECIDPDLRPQTSGASRQPHFMGIDVGLKGDGSALAIGHLEQRPEAGPIIVVDVIEQIKAGEGKYKDNDRLEFDDVADWVKAHADRFYIAEGLFDQWAGIPFEQALAKRGVKGMRSKQLSQNLTSEIFKNFKDMMWDRRLVLYDWPISDGRDHCDYIEELLELQEEKVSKHITKVQAPQIEGKHDDRSDALVRMVWLATQRITQSKYIAKGRGVSRAAERSVGRRASNFRRLRETGSHESRQVSAQRQKQGGGWRRSRR